MNMLLDILMWFWIMPTLEAPLWVVILMSIRLIYIIYKVYKKFEDDFD